MRDTPTMQHESVTTGDTSLAWFFKVGLVWTAERLAHLIQGITANDIATYLAIIYTSLMIVNHIRKEWLRKQRDSEFAPTQPQGR